MKASHESWFHRVAVNLSDADRDITAASDRCAGASKKLVPRCVWFYYFCTTNKKSEMRHASLRSIFEERSFAISKHFAKRRTSLSHLGQPVSNIRDTFVCLDVSEVLPAFKRVSVWNIRNIGLFDRIPQSPNESTALCDFAFFVSTVFIIYVVPEVLHW